MSWYTDAKYALSDGLCVVLEPATPAAFAQYCSRFIDGFIVTGELLVLSCLIGFIVAVGVVLARLSQSAALSWVATSYCYVLRGTPLLVQLWLAYFGLGALGAENLGPFWPIFSNSWLVGLLVLILNTSAYVAEILRGGLVNLHRGQMEAALACGMSWLAAMRHILLPQAIRISWPAYGNEVILLMKGSALVSTITVLDLMGQTRTIFARTYALDVYLYAAVLYLVLAALITLFFKAFERRWARQSGA